jgi:GTPase SAR1 family protein
VQLDFRTRELTIKLVYYGPALSGKTTNLQALHKVVDRDATGR